MLSGVEIELILMYSAQTSTMTTTLPPVSAPPAAKERHTSTGSVASVDAYPDSPGYIAAAQLINLTAEDTEPEDAALALAPSHGTSKTACPNDN